MKLKCDLPSDIRQRLAHHVGPEQEPTFCAVSDMTLDRVYGQTYLMVADGRVVSADSAGRTQAVKLADVKEVTIDELFGGGRLVATTAEGETGLVYYTRACVPEFAAMCRVLNDLIKGRPPMVPEEEEHAYCPRCGAPLPDRGDHCPVCVPKWSILRRLLALLAPYRGRALILMAMTFASVGAQMVPPLVTKMLVDDVIIPKNVTRLHWWIGLMLGSSVVMLGASLVSRTLGSWLAGRIVADLRTRLHSHLQLLQMSYFNRRDSGDLVARCMHDTGELQHFLIDGMPFLMVNSVTLVAIAVILIRLDAKLALLVFLPVPFLVGGGAWFWSKLIPMFHKHGSRMATMHTILGESIRGIKTVKAAAQEARRSNEFTTASESAFGVGYGIERTFVGFFEGMFFIMRLGVAAVWFFAAMRMAGGEKELTLGSLMAYISYIWMFYGPLQWFTAVLNWMTHAFSGAERIFSVLDSPPELHDAPDAVQLPQIRGGIALDDVHFSYERGKEVIRGITLDIAPGEMIGLVGKSGAGKSTIINLICRFYDVDSGVIRIDGHPIKKVKLGQLRRQIGIVMQEPFLFNGTILDNIRYGLPEATFEDVVTASRAAFAHDFIIEKEDGYDTFIGEGGASLSGGEKQRLSIARAILNDPPILILDEATSSVDSETERSIQEATANLIRNRTTIAIAHRLATLRNANRLVVIEDGRIAEMGTHDELLLKDGIYARLVKIQTELSRLKGEIWQE